MTSYLPTMEKLSALLALFWHFNDMHFWTDAWFVHNNDVQ